MKALYKYPRNVSLWRQFGQLLAQQEAFSLAESIFQKALEIDPHDLATLEVMASCHHH